MNELLQRTADEPTRPLDTAAVVGRARRQTRLARAGAGLGAAAVVAVASLVALPMVTGDGRGLEIADGPDQVGEQVAADGAGHPDGWVVLQAGELELSVPPEWEARTVASAPEPSAQGGPCVYDLYGGIGSSEGAMTSPLAVVYPMESSGACRAIGLPDVPPEQPSLVLYAGVASPDEEAGPPQGAEQQRIGSVPMWSLGSEPPGHVAAFHYRDGSAGLMVSHLDDPAMQQVLETLRYRDGREPTADARATTPSSALWGQTFASVAVIEGGVTRELIEGTEVRLTFEAGGPIRDVTGSEGGSEPLVDPAADGYLTWDVGCNHGSSQLRVQDGVLTLDGYGHHTYKLCGDEQGEQDSWLNDFLRASPRWALEGDQLVLSGDETRIILDVADQPDQADNMNESAERAPVAGSDISHWPVELRYVRDGDMRYLLRFRGTSWADWSVELREPDGSWRLVDREHPGEEFETEGGAFLDDGATADRDRFTRAPGPELIAGWRKTTGLGERVVVGLGQIPGAEDLVARLGLDPDEVEAYVSPNVRGCDLPLTACIPDGETGARGVAHLPTGFPLYAEEGVSGETAVVWLEADAIRWADPAIAPFPVDDIPRR